MSQENVEVVRKSFDVWNAYLRGELSSEAVEGTLDPQIELRWSDRQTYPDTPQHLRGVPEVIAFMDQYRGSWVDLFQEPLELLEAPEDRVVCLIRQSARGQESGVPITIHFFTITTLRHGKIRRLEYFRHRADALEAAGLSE